MDKEAYDELVKRMSDLAGTMLSEDGREVTFAEWNAACDEYLDLHDIPRDSDAAQAAHVAACTYADKKFGIVTQIHDPNLN